MRARRGRTIRWDCCLNNMKYVLVALLVFVLVSQGEALKCHCGGQHSCSGNEETCDADQIYCVSVVFSDGRSPNYLKKCGSFIDCNIHNKPFVDSISCCDADLCNS